jgi:hypothetical protein
VIGCTTAGEMCPNGFVEKNIVAMSISDDTMETSVSVMKDIKLKAILAKNDLIKTAEKIGVKPTDPTSGVIMTLISGLTGDEEKVLSVLGSTFPNMPLAGGTAAENITFNEKSIYLSANGEVFQNAAIVTFIKSANKITAFKENMYEDFGREDLMITKIDSTNRIIYEFNGKKAANEYARILGITVDDIPKYIFKHPLGRVFDEKVWITSIFKVTEDNGILFACNLVKGSTLRVLKPVENIVAEAERSMKTIRTDMNNVHGAVIFNCLYRYLHCKMENNLSQINSVYSKNIPQYVGFQTYGEQFGKYMMNATLTALVFGDR